MKRYSIYIAQPEGVDYPIYYFFNNAANLIYDTSYDLTVAYNNIFRGYTVPLLPKQFTWSHFTDCDNLLELQDQYPELFV